MTEVPQELLDSLRSARACMADIRKLAGKFDHLTSEDIEPLLLKLVDAGEDPAVSRLLQTCAFNEVRLDPVVLCRCIGVCEEVPDSAPCFALQDEQAVPALLARSAAQELSIEWKIYAACLATELTVKFGLDPHPVQKVLWKHEQSPLPSHHKLFITHSLGLLEKGSSPWDPPLPLWTDFRVSDLLPETRPRAMIGGDYTVRRPIPKLGRNEPCHCGSGKKYKKCCYVKDQELLRDASQYAGATRSELKSRPGLVDDPDIIWNMRAYELKTLKPSELGENQLYTGYECALGYGLRELAFEMLKECEKRPSKNEFDQGHFEDLIERVLEAGDLDLARKIRDYCRDHSWYRPHAIQFRFDLLENPERFDPLEQDCRKSVSGIFDEETLEDEPLIDLVYVCAPQYPALAIVLARAAIVSNPDRHLDNQVLLDLVRDIRVDLDLEPWKDPAESLFDWIEHRTHLKEKEDAENEQIKKLSARLEAARSALAEKKRALRDMEEMAKEVGKKPEKDHQPPPQDTLPGPHPDIAADENRKKTLIKLRVQVASLKAEISAQQEQRGHLRKLLEQERKKSSALSTRNKPEQRADPDEETVHLAPSGRPILPEYADAFRRTCETLAPNLVAKAIMAAGDFAAHDKAIWRQAKPLKRLPEHYRIRISLDYRMILRWQPGKSLRILDVIPRQDLESWIKRRG